MEPELLTDELMACIGRTSGPNPLPEEISASDVRRYVDATDDRNPLWLDHELAQRHGYRGRVVPPALVTELSWRTNRGEGGAPRSWHADLPLPDDYNDARNAGLETDWLEAVCVGDRLEITDRIVDIQARHGRAGLGIYVTRESEFRNQRSEVVARVRQTVVRLPRARSDSGPAAPRR